MQLNRFKLCDRKWRWLALGKFGAGSGNEESVDAVGGGNRNVDREVYW